MRRPRQQPEKAIHKALVEHLRLRGEPGIVYLHIPNEGRRSRREGALQRKVRRTSSLSARENPIF
jgi:hypothetical protein